MPDHRASPIASLSPEERKKLFWLGLVESVPLLGGGVFSIYTDSKVLAIVAAFIAIALTGVVCWCLRHQTPLTRVEMTQKKSDDHISREATRQA
jgi:hypothetical protein